MCLSFLSGSTLYQEESLNVFTVICSYWMTQPWLHYQGFHHLRLFCLHHSSSIDLCSTCWSNTFNDLAVLCWDASPDNFWLPVYFFQLLAQIALSQYRWPWHTTLSSWSSYNLCQIIFLQLLYHVINGTLSAFSTQNLSYRTQSSLFG